MIWVPAPPYVLKCINMCTRGPSPLPNPNCPFFTLLYQRLLGVLALENNVIFPSPFRQPGRFPSILEILDLPLSIPIINDHFKKFASRRWQDAHFVFAYRHALPIDFKGTMDSVKFTFSQIEVTDISGTYRGYISIRIVNIQRSFTVR